MNNNLAALLSVNLDSYEVLQSEFKNFAEKINLNWYNRHYFYMHSFTDYFKELLDKILDEINLPYYDILLQLHHKDYYFEKEHLSVIHNDKYRKSCITIPIFMSDTEPVQFYNLENTVVQTSIYTKNHPSLVNVFTNHAIKITDMENPRILLQISYKHGFEDIIARNPSIWKIYE